MDEKNKECRVCGYRFESFYPWGEDMQSPSFYYCLCCFTEFGHNDYSLEGIKQSRDAWIKNGYKWYEPDKKPRNWSPNEQMKNIPEEYK